MLHSRARVLIVDDDQELVELLQDYLVQDGFDVRTAAHGDAGLAQLAREPVDIVVLDYMMPGKSGIEVLKALRARSHVPVLMLTARGDDADRIVGLELGADDYVPKPCSPRELAARLRAILKRTQNADPLVAEPPPPLQVGQLVIWPALRKAEMAGRPLELTSTEFNLLETLARHAGAPVSKEELSQRALGRAHTRFDRAIDVHVSSIRHKLGALPDGRPPIQTVIRMGYQLVMS